MKERIFMNMVLLLSNPQKDLCNPYFFTTLCLGITDLLYVLCFTALVHNILYI